MKLKVVFELKRQNSVDDNVNSLAEEDLTDDLIEMSSQFANKELDKIIADIPNFRLINHHQFYSQVYGLIQNW